MEHIHDGCVLFTIKIWFRVIFHKALYKEYVEVCF